MSPEIFTIVLWIWAGVAAATFVALQFLAAPYGRHGRGGWGPTIHRTPGWVLVESPAVFVFVWFVLCSDRAPAPASLLFAAIWLLHYGNRTFIFPFRMRGGNLRMPLLIAGMGFAFNLVNGYLQGSWLYHLGPERGGEWLLDLRFLAGLAIFAFGFWLNLRSDAILRNLRPAGESGYRVPHGAGYRFVSCPNYLGELLEWLGWASLTWSPAGLLFFFWTAANLVPRAVAHHRWYRRTFPDYPAGRRAIIPFLY